jgi:hypothetical protein
VQFEVNHFKVFHNLILFPPERENEPDLDRILCAGRQSEKQIHV